MRALLLLVACCVLSCAAAPLKHYELPEDKRRQAVEIHRQRNLLYFGGVAWDIAVLLLLVRTRAATRIRSAVEGRLRSRFLTAATTAAGVMTLLWIAGVPFLVYRHWLNLTYGLSVQPWLPWLADAVKAAVVTAAPAALLAAGALAIIHRRPRRWWVYAGIAGALTMIAATYAVPLVVDPLFFNFRPLAESRPHLIRPLQDVATRAGYSVPAERIFEMDASRKTPTMNAYITGIGDSRRIVIWDTTIEALTPVRIQTVFAHELGHYALRHIPRSLAMASVGLFGLLWLLDRLLGFIVRRHGARLGIRGMDDPAVLPAAFLLALAITFAAEPLVNTYSRWQEHQADRYELELMDGLIPNAGWNSAEVTQKLAEISLELPNPHPFIVFWRYSHPPADQRMTFAQEFAPSKP